MYEYPYSREVVSDHYNIDNPDRVDGSLQPIHLAKEVSDFFTTKNFTLICSGTTATFKFETELTTQDQTDLTTLVNNHKNNT